LPSSAPIIRCRRREEVTKIVLTEQSAAGEPVVRREISVSDFFSVQGGPSTS
jgi:hypothetical protein